MHRASNRCTACGSSSTVPIVYGFPNSELDAQARRGEVVLGGCTVMGDEPDRHCKACGHQWRRKFPKRGESDSGRTLGRDTPAADFFLAIDGPTFSSAIRVIRSWLPDEQLQADASLWYEGNELAVRVGADEARVPARGSWPGIVVVPAAFLIEGLVGAEAEEVRLAIEADRIRIGSSFSMGYRLKPVRDPWPRFIDGWERMTLLEKLMAPTKFTQEDVRYSGLTKRVDGAEAILEGVLAALEDVAWDVGEAHDLNSSEIVAAVKKLLETGLGRSLG